MPKLSDYLDTYRRLSGKASDVSRNLSFAGIALIWIFKCDSQNGPVIPRGLLFPLILFAASLFCDLMQYCLGAVIWGSFFKYQEKAKYRKYGKKAVESDPDVDSPKYFPLPQEILFSLKLLFVLWSYALLVTFLYHQWYKV